MSALPSRLIAGAACAAAVLLAGQQARAASLDVAVRGVQPGGGRVFVSLCAGGLEPANCALGTSADASAETLLFRFPAVPPGTYAVAAFQDTDGNGVLDRTRNGFPAEPYGFSNDAGRTRVPRFDRAAFSLAGDGSVTVRLTSIASRR